MTDEKLSSEVVRKIASLARLELSEAEVSLFQERLGSVLGYVRELDQVPAPDQANVQHIPRDVVGMREDRALEFPDVEDIFINAPDESERHFRLPAIMDQD